jgi:hypothetical protein
LDRFGQVGRRDLLGGGQVGHGAGDLQDAVVGASREVELLDSGAQERLAGAIYWYGRSASRSPWRLKMATSLASAIAARSCPSGTVRRQFARPRIRGEIPRWFLQPDAALCLGPGTCQRSLLFKAI